MTGPLAQQFAQVREGSALLADWAEEPLGMGSVDVDNVRGRLLEALSAIERHVQDMEKALTEASERLGELTRPPWLENTPLIADVRDSIRAALPAREKGTE